MAAQLSPAEASAVVEAALEACFGWSDPMAVALAVPAAPSGDVERIAKALRPVLDADDAARAAAAIVARAVPEGRSSSSEDDDEEEGGGGPGAAGDPRVVEWAAPGGDLDAALAAFDAWVAPDAREAAAARGLVSRLEAVAAGVARFPATLEAYGSRACGVALFDSDVDARLLEPLDLDAVARRADAEPWSRDVEVIHARVPLVRGRCRDSGLSFDLSRASDATENDDDGDGDGERLDNATEAFADVAAARPAFAPVYRFFKVASRQRGLGEVHGGGLGSFRLGAMVANVLEAREATLAPGAALLAVAGAYASEARVARSFSFRGTDVDLGVVDDPRAVARLFADVAANVRAGGLGAALDVPGLARARAKFRRRGAPTAAKRESAKADDAPSSKRARRAGLEDSAFPPQLTRGILKEDSDMARAVARSWRALGASLATGDTESADVPTQKSSDCDPRVTALWARAQAESIARRDTVRRQEELREQRIREASKLEAIKREQRLAEIERSRKQELVRNAQQIENEQKSKDNAEAQRKRDREAARRNRDKLEQTVDLDKQRLAVSSFLETVQRTDDLKFNESP